MRSFPIALALLFCNVFLMAKDKVSITSEPSWLLQVKRDASKKPDLKNVSNGYYLELFDRQTNIINNTIYTHFIRHIANETGVQNASEISISYSPSYQNVVFHKIQVIRNGVVINHLNMKEIAVVQEETDAQDFLYYGMKRAFVVLKDIRKNDKIEASYSVIGFNPIFNNKFSSEVYLYTFNPITEYFESIIAEPGRKLNFNYYLNAAPPKEEIIAGNKVYHWDNPELKIWDSKNNSPSWYNQYPYITISKFSSWQEVSGWALTLYNHYDHQLPKDLLERINEWKSAAKTDKDEFARLALRFVQDEIRYLGFEVGINTHKPHEPREVYSKGYGDCKDKALLLATILRHENITAYVALVNTEKKGEMYKSAPDPGEFNHVIVAIERENGLLYVDPTISMQKGELSDNYIPPYGYALVVRENESNLR